jgi:hypothetical protein
VLNVIPAMQADTAAQEKSVDLDQQTVSFEGYCGNEDCLVNTVKKCELSETTVRSASKMITIISVGGDGLYQGRSVCKISINEENVPSANNMASLQSWSYKVPIVELQKSTFANVDELTGRLVASEYCAVQAP